MGELTVAIASDYGPGRLVISQARRDQKATQIRLGQRRSHYESRLPFDSFLAWPYKVDCKSLMIHDRRKADYADPTVQ